jgi:geranylgeranyl pyrophosphate synthase
MHSNDARTSLVQVERLMLELVVQGAGDAGTAAAHHLSAGGARVRARLALHAGRALQRPESECIAIAAACELLHNASLVHDDLQDRDQRRRGQAAVWHRYGDAVAICVGDLMLSAAYAALGGAGAAAAGLSIRMHRRVAEVIGGQCSDLALQGGISTSLEDYERIASGKSAPLLVLPLEMALMLAGREDAVGAAAAAGSLFAIGYQVADDLQDADQDAASRELNIVSVLSASGEAAPHDRARDLAILRFRQAHAAAAGLPSGSGGLLAIQASERAERLTRALEPA